MAVMTAPRGTIRIFLTSPLRNIRMKPEITNVNLQRNNRFLVRAAPQTYLGVLLSKGIVTLLSLPR
jgi:hypothetical protein